MNPNTLKRLAALERIRTTVSPGRMSRSREDLAGLLRDYDHLWLSDGATLQTREERYLENLRRVDAWGSTSLTDNLERYQELFS